MVSVLVGFSGFVGSNLKSFFKNEDSFNSKIIVLANKLTPDFCIYAGVKSEKFFANQFPMEDLIHINDAFENIKRINPKKLILISTIDVYGDQLNKNENFNLTVSTKPTYGSNRLYLEYLISNFLRDYHIIRLPALFGVNLKKNFIFDIMNPIPRKLSKQKFQELSTLNLTLMGDAYFKINDGFYELNTIKYLQNPFKDTLIEFLIKNKSTSLEFTDSRSSFQFYNLNNLWNDIQRVVHNNIKLINLVSEPINAAEIYDFVFNKEFRNFTSKFYSYNIKSVYSELWNNSKGYLYPKSVILHDIKEFINRRLV
jgi:hypothetical protein